MDLKLEPTSVSAPGSEANGSLDAALCLKLGPSSDAASKLGFGPLTGTAPGLKLSTASGGMYFCSCDFELQLIKWC